jgi:hypothetical protein
MVRMLRAIGLVAGVMLALPAVAVGQGSTPEPCPAAWQPPDPHILWETPSARLEADAIEMRRGECVFTGVGPATVSSDPGGPDYRTLEVIWEEQGARVGMNIYFAADENDWWVTEIRTPVGEFRDPTGLPRPLADLTRTPRGSTLEGDITIGGGRPDAPQLTFSGLQLTAFAPGTGPAPLTGCTNAIEPYDEETQEERIDVTAEGQPLHGTGIMDMRPADAEALLRERGYCFTFRYEYPTAAPTDGSEFGYSERWCTAPPTGRITEVMASPSGELIVFVREDTIMPERPQPPEGWNCPAE